MTLGEAPHQKANEIVTYAEEKTLTDRMVRVVAPSRLHFGMLSTNHPGPRRYGGVGAMVDAPGLEITLRPAERFEVLGPLSDRARNAARLAMAALATGQGRCEDLVRACAEVPCRIEVIRIPPLHVGLGTGTQLAMAVAAGVSAWLDRPPCPPDRLARCVRRGRRSAIGLYGFAYGGLLYESGKAEEEEIAPLQARVEIPAAWRFVLARPRDLRGLSGEAERQAFAALPPAPNERAEWLRREALHRMFPAAAEARFEDFSDSLFRFGLAAGSNFAAAQGGPFAGPRLAALVEWIRAQGIRGVGQTSWGPTVFALLPNEDSARDLVRRLLARPDGRSLEVTVAPPNNRGAQVHVATADPCLAPKADPFA